MFIIIYLITIASNLNLISSCSCPPIIKWKLGITRQYSSVDAAFVAKSVCLDDINRIYELEVKEVFKGNVEVGDIVRSTDSNSCGAYIVASDNYLFLGDYHPRGDVFEISGCGYSRSITHIIGSERDLGSLPQTGNAKYLNVDKIVYEQLNILSCLREQSKN